MSRPKNSGFAPDLRNTALASIINNACVLVLQVHKSPFVTAQGLGNDFVLVDNRNQVETLVTEEQAVKLCDRNFGIGGDGVIFALPPTEDGCDYSMRIFNSDGSEPEMCGNGIRCLARFVADLDGAATSHRVNTLAGLMVVDLRDDGQVSVDMGEPILEPAEVPTTLPATKDGAAVQAPLEAAVRARCGL
ncbi:hypothetical protein CYMTET_12880 [Cymbomonas tetramitiformis]|uniref:diaminopimelate epimerase n=1 Tax=Cymbomonas tetramitiformis TaxID=36881 RepID=A0AAE0GJJ5_9CHLO|nr:hypothetical protein CYMTET_12880 [Cymbomonas tetramitiformis]